MFGIVAPLRPDQAMHMGTNCLAAFAQMLPTKFSGSRTHTTAGGGKLICDPGILLETLRNLPGNRSFAKSIFATSLVLLIVMTHQYFSVVDRILD